MTYKSVGAIVARVQPSLYTLVGVKGDVTKGLALILDKKALWWLNKEQKRRSQISLKSGFMGLDGISILHVWPCFARNNTLSSWWYCLQLSYSCLQFQHAAGPVSGCHLLKIGDRIDTRKILITSRAIGTTQVSQYIGQCKLPIHQGRPLSAM